MSSLATEDIAVPGDILCMVLRQNVGQRQTKMGQANHLGLFGAIVLPFSLFLNTLKLAKFHNKAKRQEVTRVS